jgi:hypothetical protein
MTAADVPLILDIPLSVCRVRESVVVHLTQGSTADPRALALCGGAVIGRPQRPFVRSPCLECVRSADDQGLPTVRDLTTAWVNLRRLAIWLRAAA